MSLTTPASGDEFARNPFLPQPGAPKGAARAAPALPPVQLPGAAPYLGDILPPPLPPRPGERAPELPGTPGTPAPKEPAVAKPATEGSKPARKPTTSYLSREDIEAARARCDVRLRSPALVRVSGAGGTIRLRLDITGGRACVKALMADEDWLHVGELGADGAAEVHVAANPDEEDREATLVVANTGTSLSVRVLQRGSPVDFLAVEPDSD